MVNSVLQWSEGPDLLLERDAHRSILVQNSLFHIGGNFENLFVTKNNNSIWDSLKTFVVHIQDTNFSVELRNGHLEKMKSWRSWSIKILTLTLTVTTGIRKFSWYLKLTALMFKIFIKILSFISKIWSFYILFECIGTRVNLPTLIFYSKSSFCK